MLPLALLALLAVDDGFGGAPAAPSSPTSPSAPAPAAPAGDAECVIQGEDGVWRSCLEALELKKREPTAADDDEALRDMSPEAQALRERMKALDHAAKSAKPGDVVDEPLPKTKLEIEYDKARLDVSQPLLALRIDVARAEARVQQLEKLGVGGKKRDEADAKATDMRAILDDVEHIAMSRMDNCLQRMGKKPVVKNYRMTAGGPVLMTMQEMLRQLPAADPDGCQRTTLVDDALIAKAKRRRELTRILDTRNFGYHEVAQRKAFEQELAQLDKELATGVPQARR